LSDQINVALVGAGYWGKNLARNFYELGALKVVCDASEEALERKKSKYPGIGTSVSYVDVLRDPSIQAVAIATPAEQHYSMVKDALLAGKHVYVEKPLSITEREGGELVALAKNVDRTLFVGHILQYHPAILEIKRMLSEGELGRLQYIYSNRLNLGKFRREENILWSFAPHDISVILSLVNEEPHGVRAVGSNILHPKIADTTLTHLDFPSGVGAHIFVSWLHPFKEQKLVVVGDGGMIVFDDLAPAESKLTLYPHTIRWQGGIPVPEKKQGVPVDLSQKWTEPLASECKAFLGAVAGQPAVTDGEEGLRVLKVLQRAQESMDHTGAKAAPKKQDYFVHETSVVDPGCEIGSGSKIWHFSHILKDSRLGKGVNVGQNVVIGPHGDIGNNVKIQNNVSIYEGVVLEDNVFCGPSCVFTNVINPRSAISRKTEFKKTLVREGATIGANATIVCGTTIGRHAFIGAGAVVTKDVPDYALVYGNPARVHGWMCQCGTRLNENRVCHACDKQMAKN